MAWSSPSMFSLAGKRGGPLNKRLSQSVRFIPTSVDLTNACTRHPESQKLKMSKELSALQDELSSVEARAENLRKAMAGIVAGMPENKDLMYFYGDGCPFTDRVAPAVACLERSIGQRVHKLECWGNEANAELWVAVGGKKHCGGFPFFYNASTEAFVCGATSCEKLKEWAASSSRTKPVPTCTGQKPAAIDS